MITRDSIARARSVLAVPGHRPDRFVKAVHSGADSVMLDLEDAVGPDLKSAARKNISDWLESGGEGIVRINGVETPWYEKDVEMLAGRRCAVVLPKVTSPLQIELLLRRLAEGSFVIALLETAAGILGAREICATPGVVRAIFGNGDLASELGIDLADHVSMSHARSQIVLASAAGGLVPPLDGLTIAITDDQKLKLDAQHSVAMGFTGKVCIHPRQIHTVHEIFTPSSTELQWAREALAASHDGSVAVLNGKLVGTPMLERARRLLSQWEA
ncbi:CoA ester lyase [Amycolatopsis sp. RM579]|uniref:CoA ester lyase n=1 Tax=Amycolatopsis pithecellobii TaxID=664692 RepID=A0A6N7Z6P4_9PSEU|nr:CoA ester lyase [Amycolatopsis pithecellobii]